MMKQITSESIRSFEEQLYLNEKSKATVEKYTLALRRLMEYLQGMELTKARLLSYREHLQTQTKAQTVNGALSAIHAYLDFAGWQECKVKLLKVQRQAFLDESRELSEAEYKRLLSAAKNRGNERLYLLMTTICGTGIRVNELEYITVEASKVFPHNLRHLFARTFYAVEKNLAHLADVLGHSRIETTRIYVPVSAAAHERVLNRMRLIQ